MKTLRLASLAAALALVAGCASTPSTPQQTLEERAQARWDHLVAGEAELALEYYTPGFRDITSAVDYTIWVRNRPVRWTGAEVKDSSCESEDRCTVVVNVAYRVPGGPPGINAMRMARDIEETWIRIDDDWFYVRN